MRAVYTVAIFALLAGCAGSGSRSSLPAVATNGGDRSPQSAPLGTLYVAQVATVIAYPLGANGPTSPARTITPHPNQTQVIEGVATSADGTLDILEDYFVTPSSPSSYCRVVVESATASGSPAAIGTHLCDPTDFGQGEGIAANTGGGYDVLFTDTTSGQDVLRRFGSDGGSTINTLVLNFFPFILGTDRGGHDYLTATGLIRQYKATTTDPTVFVDTLLAGGAGTAQIWAIAVSPGSDRTVYVAAGPLAGGQNIYAFAPDSGTPTRTIGPFPNNDVSAMAVDSQGSLYVGLNPIVGGVGSFIRVYDSAATGKATPTRQIYPSPAETWIEGLAIGP